MGKIKKFTILYLFNRQAAEAVFIDSWFEAFADGLPRDELPSITGPLVWTQSRIIVLLTERGYLKSFGKNGFIITSNGLMFLAKGGFTSEIIREKTDRWALWVSFLATIISISAFFLAL